MQLELSNSVYKEIKDHGSKTFPNECCGFLFGSIDNDIRIVSEIKIQDNEFEQSQENRFLITPESYKLAEEYGDKIDKDLLGFYHSHPDSPAIPSQYDIDHAWPWYSYLIISVLSGKPGELLAWQLREDRSKFDKVILNINATG